MSDYNRFIKRMAEDVYPEETKKKQKEKESKDNDKTNESRD